MWNYVIWFLMWASIFYFFILQWIFLIVKVFWGNEIIRMRNSLKAGCIKAEIIDFTVPDNVKHSDRSDIIFNNMYRKKNYYYSVVTYRYGEVEHTGKVYRYKKDYIGRVIDIDIMEDCRICRTKSVSDSPYIADSYWAYFMFLPFAAGLLLWIVHFDM